MSDVLAAAAPAAAAGAQPLSLPWGAWHGDAVRRLDVPARWQVVELNMVDAPALPRAAVERALECPIDAPPLDGVAAGTRTVAIAIDDTTRPTNTAPIVDWIVHRLCESGIALSDITVVVASGAHRSPSTRDFMMKLGGLAGRLHVVAHDPTGELVPTGTELAGVPVRVNRVFMEADLRIGVGCVMPHPFAAFSGGGKIVIPGLADLEVVARTHRFALMGLQGGGKLETNAFRTQMERAVRDIGLGWSVSVVVNSRRATAFVAAGDFVAAHRCAAVESARIGSTRQPETPLDAIIVNAYPKDGELLQAEAALVALRNGMINWLTPDAPVVLASACSEGLGTHALFGPGGRLFRNPTTKTFLGRRPLWLFAPGIAAPTARVVMHDSYPVYSEWPALVSDLSRRLPPDARVGVVPCGPLQLAREERC